MIPYLSERAVILAPQGRDALVAQSMLGEPRLLALDEPTAELDGETAERVSALVLEAARSAVVVMTTHMADTLAPRAAAVIRIEGPRSAQAPPA